MHDHVAADPIPVRVAVVLALTLAACGETGTTTEPDASVLGWDGGFEVPEPTTPAPPERPAPAALTPCPEGWREVPAVDEGGVAVCDPWPVGGHAECGVDEAHFPGEPGCRRIGTPCPVGPWAEDLPDGDVVYVLAGAPPGGSGTPEAPYGTIAEATAAASDGTVIALSTGAFDEVVALRSSVTLWGACVAGTVVSSSSPSGRVAVVTIFEGDVVIGNLQIRGERPGISVEQAHRARVQDVLVSGTVAVGLAASAGGTIIGDTVVVRAVRSLADRTCSALYAQGMGRLELSRVALDGNELSAVTLMDTGTTAALSDVVVRDCGWTASDTGFRIVYTLCGAALDLQRAVLEHNKGTAIEVTDWCPEDERFGDSSISVEDTVVRDTNGRGLQVIEGADADLDRVVFERNAGVGMYLGMYTTDTVTDAVVRDTTNSGGLGHSGIGISGGAQATLARVLLERNQGYGLTISDHWVYGTRAMLEDIVVRDMTCPEAVTEETARGAVAISAATVAAERVLIEDVSSYGVLIVRSDPEDEDGVPPTPADVRVQDLTVTRVDGCGVFDGGYALGVGGGSAAVVARALVEEAQIFGMVFVETGTTAELSDLVVRDTLSEPNGGFGRGLEVQRGAVVQVSRAVFERSRDAAIHAASPGTRVDAVDVVITNTLGADCATTTCPEIASGHGLVSLGEAVIDVRRFLISRSALCGVMLAHGYFFNEDGLVVNFQNGGAADLHEGFVTNNVIGANVQSSGFDVARLADRVGYRDNDRNLDTDDLPIPDIWGDDLPEPEE